MRRAWSGSRSGSAASSPSISGSTARWRPASRVLVDGDLERRGVELLQAADLRRRERLAGHVGERCAAPEPQCLAGRALREQPFEPSGIHILAGETQLVAAAVRGDHVLLAERLAQMGDVELDELERRGRRVVTPEAVDQPVRADRRSGLQRQHREHGALLGAAEADRAVITDGLDRPEEVDAHLTTHRDPRTPAASAPVRRPCAELGVLGTQHPAPDRQRARAQLGRSGLVSAAIGNRRQSIEDAHQVVMPRAENPLEGLHDLHQDDPRLAIASARLEDRRERAAIRRCLELAGAHPRTVPPAGRASVEPAASTELRPPSALMGAPSNNRSVP